MVLQADGKLLCGIKLGIKSKVLGRIMAYGVAYNFQPKTAMVVPAV